MRSDHAGRDEGAAGAALRRIMVTSACAVPAGLALGAVTQGADHVDRALAWVGGLGAPWIAFAFALGALSRSRAAGAIGGAVALVTATGTWYALHVAFAGTLRVAPVAVAWAVAAVLVGAVFGFAGAHWRAGHVAPVALLAGALAGEALALTREWPERVQHTLLAAQVAGAALAVFLLTPRATLRRALPAILALTLVATAAMAVAAGELRDAARAAGWNGR